MFSANSSQVSEDRLYVEDVFSTWLYTGNGSTQTITNGIDLAGKGGLTWIKARSVAGADNNLFDTNRGATKRLFTNTTDAEITTAGTLTSFSSSGFALGSQSSVNQNTTTYASWTFRKAPKFFDVVTFTTTSNGSVTFNHSLGITPGAILFKSVDGGAENWWVWHRSTGDNNYLVLNTTAAQASFTGWCAPTSTQVVIGTSGLSVSKNYVAYLFAHDTTSDGIIQCGSFNATSSAGSVNLGWEPQWVLFKATNAAVDWYLWDTMRGFVTGVTSAQASLSPNSSAAEVNNVSGLSPTATGFDYAAMGANFIYIAIRRGPMRTPTSGTSVFSPSKWNTSGDITTGFPVDLQITRPRLTAADYSYVIDRLRGISSTTTPDAKILITALTNAESGNAGLNYNFDNTKFTTGSSFTGAANGANAWSFRRAPSFFDVVCYTGTGVARTVNHNLGVAPELMIVKRRDAAGSGWAVYTAPTGATKYMYLQSTIAAQTYTDEWNNTSPTASVFTVGIDGDVNTNGGTYAAYLFASCPGVSKCGSYTGNGSSQTINCGFAAGARFILIKRTDSTGDWYVWDTARGIVAGNDPRLSLNSTAAEVTTDDSIDTDSSGFVVNQLSATNINVSSATYIYLAVA